MVQEKTAGFWERKQIRERLLRPLEDRGIRTVENEPAWRQLRRQVITAWRSRNAPEYTPKTEQIYRQRARPGKTVIMLMHELEFEQRLPKLLLAFAGALRDFHRSMRKRWSGAYREPARAVFDKPKARAFLEVYRNLDFSSAASVLKDLGDIQSKGVRCPTASGAQSTIRLVDYGIEDLVRLTTELEELWANVNARRRKREAMSGRVAGNDGPQYVTLELLSGSVVKVHYKVPSWNESRNCTLRGNEAKLLIQLYWAHKQGAPCATYAELAKALPLDDRVRVASRKPENSKNRFSALRLALHNRLKDGFKLAKRPQWVRCQTNVGYRLDTDQFIWRETKDRSEKRTAAAIRGLKQRTADETSQKRRGRQGTSMP